MDTEDVRPWVELPRECLEMITRRGGPQAAASLSATCKSWRSELADDALWRSWHAMPLLRYHTRQTSYSAYARSLCCWLAGAETATSVVPHAHERWLTSLDLSPTHVLSGSLDANVKYWDRSRPGTWVHYLRGHTGPVSSVRLACDAVGGSASTSYPLSSSSSSSASWPSSCCSRAFSGSRDGTLRCWDLRTGTCVRAYTLEGGRQWVNTVAVWRPQQPQQQGAQLMHLLNVGGSRGLAAQDLNAAAAAAAAVAAAGAPVDGAAAGAGPFRATAGAVGHFGAMGGALHGAMGAAAAAATAAPLSPWASSSSPSAEPPTASGAMAVVCGTSIGQLCLYDVRQSVPAQRLQDLQQQGAGAGGQPPGAVYGVTCFGDALAAACASGAIYVWDLRAGAVRHRLDEHGSACTCVAMYGDTLVAGDLEGNVYLWSTREEGESRFRGALAPAAAAAAAAARRRQQAPATAGPRAAASGGGAAATPAAAARVPAGPRWPVWRSHRRRGGTFEHSVLGDISGDSSGSDNEDDGRTELGPRRGVGVGFDGAATVAALQALAEGRASVPVPCSRGQLPPPPSSPWLRSRPTAAAAVTPAVGGSPTEESAAAPPPPPRLRATMRHTEWVRDVALLGPTLVLSCSKDGLVCLSRTDTMQVVAVWDVAAAPGSGTRSDASGGSADTGSSGGGGGGQVVNQVHAMAADEWGFVAGCQDASMRSWSFAPDGTLPELWAPAAGSYEARGRAAFTEDSMISDMRRLNF